MIGELPQKCDVAVIGAGIGGLTAATLLSNAGYDVCVVDREARVGGYLAGFRRKQFIFDTAIHWLNQCGPGGLVHKVFKHLGDDAPVAPLLNKIRRYKGESFDYLLTSDPDVLKAQLLREFPEDAAGIEHFFASAKVIGVRLTRLMAEFSRSRDTFSVFDALRAGIRKSAWGIPFLRYLGDKDGKRLDKLFTNPKLRSVFCSEDNILSALVPVGWAYAGDFQMPPAGGSQAFPQWMTRLIRERGSRVVLRAGVDKVLMEGNQAVGLRLEKGQELRARWVIAACDVETLFSKMLPSGVIPPKRIQAFQAAELYSSCVTISAGLDCEPQSLGFGEELVFLTRDGISRKAHSSGDPQVAGLSVLAPSLRDPTVAPPGKGTMTVYCSANLDYGDRWKTGPDLERGEAYKAFKNEYAQVVLERVEKAIAPGLRKHVEILAIATPVTHLRYTGNKDGTIMGQMPSRGNIRARVAGSRTPVRNLLIGGHWAQYGGGVPVAVAAGSNAALIVLKKEKPSAYAALSSVLDSPWPGPVAARAATPTRHPAPEQSVPAP